MHRATIDDMGIHAHRAGWGLIRQDQSGYTPDCGCDIATCLVTHLENPCKSKSTCAKKQDFVYQTETWITRTGILVYISYENGCVTKVTNLLGTPTGAI